MKIKNIMIAGGGTLGSQVAWQCAVKGFNVVVYDAFDKGVATSKAYHQKFAALFVNERGMTQQEKEGTFNRLSYSTNLAEAVADIDIVSESVPEDIKIKRSFYQELGSLAPEKTIFTTNSSTTLPSDYAKFTGRPEKFLAMHFANGVWEANIGEVMKHEGTDQEVFERVLSFTKEIGMHPIPILKEQNGYIINSLLIPLLRAGLDLLMNGVSNVESIDKTWMIGTNAPMGPLAILDMIGMQTTYNAEKLWGEKTGDQQTLKRAQFIKDNYINKGKMGKSSGEGFYQYPTPSYTQPGFLNSSSR